MSGDRQGRGTHRRRGILLALLTGALGDLVEAVVAKVKQEALAENLEIKLAGGPTELIYRYGIVRRAEM
jgi:hypothetical protein